MTAFLRVCDADLVDVSCADSFKFLQVLPPRFARGQHRSHSPRALRVEIFALVLSVRTLVRTLLVLPLLAALLVHVRSMRLAFRLDAVFSTTLVHCLCTPYAYQPLPSTLWLVAVAVLQVNSSPFLAAAFTLQCETQPQTQFGASKCSPRDSTRFTHC